MNKLNIKETRYVTLEELQKDIKDFVTLNQIDKNYLTLTLQDWENVIEYITFDMSDAISIDDLLDSIRFDLELFTVADLKELDSDTMGYVRDNGIKLTNNMYLSYMY